MKNYCVDLEIAKKLKDNGFPQYSYFVYYKNYLSNDIILSPKYYITNPIESKEICSAPTFEELVKNLPSSLLFNSITLGFNDSLNKWFINDPYNDTNCFSDYKLVNALAKLYIMIGKHN